MVATFERPLLWVCLGLLLAANLVPLGGATATRDDEQRTWVVYPWTANDGGAFGGDSHFGRMPFSLQALGPALLIGIACILTRLAGRLPWFFPGLAGIGTALLVAGLGINARMVETATAWKDQVQFTTAHFHYIDTPGTFLVLLAAAGLVAASIEAWRANRLASAGLTPARV